MSDRLADLIAAHASADVASYEWWRTHSVEAADAIRAAVAADPTIVGMEPALADNGYDGLWLAPAEGEATR